MSTEKKVCAHCAEWFPRDLRCTWAHWERAKYCSLKCTGLANSARAAAKRPTITKQFNSHVDRSGDCWEWTGTRDRGGYGVFMHAKKSYRAPRIALALDGRPVPNGCYACHHCDNPGCVRPSHLYPGTPTQNCADVKLRGRQNPGKRARLSPAEVIAIRHSKESDVRTAALFGVSRPTISLIREGKTWRHLP